MAVAFALALAADAIVACLAASIGCAVLDRGGSPRTRAAVRRAWRTERGRWRMLAACAVALPSLAAVIAIVLVGGARVDAGLIATPIVGGVCGPALLGLTALAAAGRSERRGRSAVARRLARGSVPWIVAGSFVAVDLGIAAGLLVGASFDPRRLVAGVLLLLAAGAIGGVAGLARKPRPAAGIALALHALGVGLAAVAWIA